MANTYARNTLGYHYTHCLAFFGEESKATKFLEEKARDSAKGYHEPVLADESQMVHVLLTIHFGEDVPKDNAPLPGDQ